MHHASQKGQKTPSEALTDLLRIVHSFFRPFNSLDPHATLFSTQVHHSYHIDDRELYTSRYYFWGIASGGMGDKRLMRHGGEARGCSGRTADKEKTSSGRELNIAIDVAINAWKAGLQNTCSDGVFGYEYFRMFILRGSGVFTALAVIMVCIFMVCTICTGSIGQSGLSCQSSEGKEVC